MSYAIIKKIKVRDNKVFITYHDNNVSPKTPCEYELPRLSAILQKQGQEALDVEILRAYEEGNFQKGENRYTRALAVLRHMSEYQQFDWRGDNEDKRQTQAFTDLLKKALKTYLPPHKFVIVKDYFGRKVYARTIRHSIKWRSNINDATVYRYLSDAECVKKGFFCSDNWQIERIK